MTICQFCPQEVKREHKYGKDGSEHYNCRKEFEKRRNAGNCCYCDKSNVANNVCESCISNNLAYLNYPGPPQ